MLLTCTHSLLHSACEGHCTTKQLTLQLIDQLAWQGPDPDLWGYPNTHAEMLCCLLPMHSLTVREYCRSVEGLAVGIAHIAQQSQKRSLQYLCKNRLATVRGSNCFQQHSALCIPVHVSSDASLHVLSTINKAFPFLLATTIYHQACVIALRCMFLVTSKLYHLDAFIAYQKG